MRDVLRVLHEKPPKQPAPPEPEGREAAELRPAAEGDGALDANGHRELDVPVDEGKPPISVPSGAQVLFAWSEGKGDTWTKHEISLDLSGENNEARGPGPATCSRLLCGPTHSPTEPHATMNTISANLPPHLQDALASSPTNVDRRTGAALVTQHLFPVSHRSLEAWPLPTRRVNGKAIIPTAKLFEAAYAKLAAAPVVMGGRRNGRAGSRIREPAPLLLALVLYLPPYLTTGRYMLPAQRPVNRSTRPCLTISRHGAGRREGPDDAQGLLGRPFQISGLRSSPASCHISPLYMTI